MYVILFQKSEPQQARVHELHLSVHHQLKGQWPRSLLPQYVMASHPAADQGLNRIIGKAATSVLHSGCEVGTATIVRQKHDPLAPRYYSFQPTWMEWNATTEKGLACSSSIEISSTLRNWLRFKKKERETDQLPDILEIRLIQFKKIIQLK